MHAQTLGAPAGGQGTCLCATRFMAPRVRDRIKTPAAAASAAGGTWMGLHLGHAHALDALLHGRLARCLLGKADDEDLHRHPLSDPL